MFSSKKIKNVFLIVLLLLISNVTFALKYYWVGNSGNWTDGTHWVTQSGGTITYISLSAASNGQVPQFPTPNDTVYFDSNSFSSISNIVTLNNNNANCRDLVYTTNKGAIQTANFWDFSLKIHGNLSSTDSIRFACIIEMHKNYAGDGYAEIYTPKKSLLQYVKISNATKCKIKSNAFFCNLINNNGELYMGNDTITFAAYLNSSISFGQGNQTTGKIYLENSVIYYRGSGLGGFGQLDGGNSKVYYYGNSTTNSNSISGVQNSTNFNYIEISNGVGGIGSGFNADTLVVNKICMNGTGYGSTPIITSNVLIFTDTIRYINNIIFNVSKLIVGNNLRTCNNRLVIENTTFNTSVANLWNPILFNYTDMYNVKFNNNGTPTATNSNDLGFNTNVNFSSNIKKRLYWIGGTGDWNSTNSWSLSSGGSSAGCIPDINTTVVFDENSFLSVGQIVNLNITNPDQPAIFYCDSMLWKSGVSIDKPEFKNIISGAKLYINGSLELVTDMNFNTTKLHTIFIGAGLEHILSNHQDFDCHVYFIGKGTLGLSDSLKIKKGELTAYGEGTFLSNDYPIYLEGAIFLKAFDTSKTLTVDMGNSIIRINTTLRDIPPLYNGHYGDCWGDITSVFEVVNRVNLSTSNSKFYISNNDLAYPTICARVFRTNTNKTPYLNTTKFKSIVVDESVNNFTINGGDSITIGTLKIANNGLLGNKIKISDTIQLNAGSTYNIADRITIDANAKVYIEGSCSNTLFLRGYSTTIGKIIKNGTPLNTQYLNINNVQYFGTNGNGNATAQNSVISGNTQGWNITTGAARTLYWVENGGDWYDKAHWSLSPGGPGGECPPIFLDDVIVDQNSFSTTATNKTVNMSGPINIHSFNAQLVTNNPIFKHDVNNTATNALTINGDFILGNNMQWQWSSNYITFNSSNGILAAKGMNLNFIIISPNANYLFLESFKSGACYVGGLCGGVVVSGGITFADSIIFSGQFHHAVNAPTCRILLGKSTSYLYGNGNILSNAILDATQATIYTYYYANNPGCYFPQSTPIKNVYVKNGTFSGKVLDTLRIDNNVTLNKVTIQNKFIVDTNIVNIIRFGDTIRFNTADEFVHLSGKTNQHLQLLPLLNTTTPYVFVKPFGSICINNCDLSYCKGYTTGNAIFRGGELDGNLIVGGVSTNPNWIFSPYSRVIKAKVSSNSNYNVVQPGSTGELWIDLLRYNGGNLNNLSTTLETSDFPIDINFDLTRGTNTQNITQRIELTNPIQNPCLLEIPNIQDSVKVVLKWVSGVGCFAIPRTISDSGYFYLCGTNSIPDNEIYQSSPPCVDVKNGSITVHYENLVNMLFSDGCQNNLVYTLTKDLPYNHSWDESCLDDTWPPIIRTNVNDTVFSNLPYGDYKLDVVCNLGLTDSCTGNNLLEHGKFDDVSGYWFNHDLSYSTVFPYNKYLYSNTDGIKQGEILLVKNQHYAGYLKDDDIVKRDSAVDFTNEQDWMMMVSPTNSPSPKSVFRKTINVEAGNFYEFKFYYRVIGDSINIDNNGIFQDYQRANQTISAIVHNSALSQTNITEQNRPSYIANSKDAWKEYKITFWASSNDVTPNIKVKTGEAKNLILIDSVSLKKISLCSEFNVCKISKIITLEPKKYNLFSEEVAFVCPKDTLHLMINDSLTYPDSSKVYWNYCCWNELDNTKYIYKTAYKKDFFGGTFGGYVHVQAQTAQGCVAKDTVYIADFNPSALKLVKIDSVLSTSASKFDDFWKPVYSSIQWQSANELNTFKSLNGFESGRAGINRTSEVYDYIDNRRQTIKNNATEVELNYDGIFNDFKNFNWHHPNIVPCVPNWKLNHTVTQYNPASFEIENKDILKRKSAALYGYGSKLEIAVAANAAYEEIGFENFEEYTDNNFHQLNNQTGNIDIVPSIIGLVYPYFDEYNIDAAFGRYALVKNIYSNLCCDIPLNVVYKGTTVEKPGLPIQIVNEKVGKILVSNSTCNDEQKLVTFQVTDKSATYPFKSGPLCDRFWTGKLLVERTILVDSQQFSKISLETNISHTGRNSIKIDTGFSSIPQYDLHLMANKNYVISAWIHTEDYLNFPPEKLENYNKSNEIGISVQVGNTTTRFMPVGEVIEGWQKLEGVFRGNPQLVSLVFSPNSKPFYLDDIRIYPENGSIQTYVYNPKDYRLNATLDQNNYATYYQYDDEGNLFSVKKETVEGIKTIQATQNYVRKK